MLKESMICYLCGKDHSKSKWNSKNEDSIHYKTTDCSCGKKLRVTVQFMGDGVDNWDGNLEQRICAAFGQKQ